MIKPKKRIHIKVACTNSWIDITVCDSQARDAVNALSVEPFFVKVKGQIIGPESLEGDVWINPCFDIGEVIATIEEAVAREPLLVVSNVEYLSRTKGGDV
jgi:hypothetical protein